MKLDGKTNEELVAMQERITSDPKNQMPKGSIFMYKPAASKKLGEIARAITDNLREAKIARGEKINDAGYSGRKSNRRR